MGKLSQLVSTPEDIEAFKAKYNIPRDVEIRPCKEGDIAQNKGFGRVVIPLIAFVKGGLGFR